jgi:hypothetical protein
MGFSLPFGKKAKMQKLVGNYMGLRVKEKAAFNKQVEWLKVQLGDKQIDKQTYERLKEILEMQYYQRQAKEWVNVESKFCNPFNS